MGVAASPHFFTNGFDAVRSRRRFKRGNGSFRTVLFSVLCAFPRDALHRFTALSGHWPFAGDSEASDCQPMPLRDGTPEWTDSLFQRRVRGLHVLLPAAQCEFVGFSEAVSSVHTRVLAGLFCPASPRTPRSFNAPLTPQGKGEMAMVAPLLPSFVRHSLCSRADLTALVKFPLFLCFCCHYMCPQGWQLERSSTRLGDRNEKAPQDGIRGSLKKPLVFSCFFRYPYCREFFKRTQCVRRVRRQRHGGFPRAFLQGSVPQDGPVRYVLFNLHRGLRLFFTLCASGHTR